jgi:hypothetical protein
MADLDDCVDRQRCARCRDKSGALASKARPGGRVPTVQQKVGGLSHAAEF